MKTPHGEADFLLWYGQLPPITEAISMFHPKTEAKIKKVTAKKNKRASISQEREVMEALGGRRHPGSGALGHLKGDGRVRNKYRVEMKYTRHDSFKLDRKDLSKIRGECSGLEAPLYVVDFVDPITGGSPDRWVMLPFTTFQKMDQDAADLDRGPSKTR